MREGILIEQVSGRNSVDILTASGRFGEEEEVPLGCWVLGEACIFGHV